jgi:hypothetical protein
LKTIGRVLRSQGRIGELKVHLETAGLPADFFLRFF